MGINAKVKGRVGESQAIHLLQPVIDECYLNVDIAAPKLRRSVSGGFDVVGLDWMALEVKNCKTLNLEKWWQQTELQCLQDKQPILMYKIHGARKGWRAMHIMNGHRVIMLQDDWLKYFKSMVQCELDTMLENLSV